MTSVSYQHVRGSNFADPQRFTTEKDENRRQWMELLNAYSSEDASSDVGLQSMDDGENDPTYATSYSCLSPDERGSWEDSFSDMSDPNYENVDPAAHQLQLDFVPAHIKGQDSPWIFDAMNDFDPSGILSMIDRPNDVISSILHPKCGNVDPAADPLPSDFLPADMKGEEFPLIFDAINDFDPSALPSMIDSPDDIKREMSPSIFDTPNEFTPGALPSMFDIPNDSINCISFSEMEPDQGSPSEHPAASSIPVACSTPNEKRPDVHRLPGLSRRHHRRAQRIRDRNRASISDLRKIAPKPQRREISVIPDASPSSDSAEELFESFCLYPDDKKLENFDFDSHSDSSGERDDHPMSDISELHAEQSRSGHAVEEIIIKQEPPSRSPSPVIPTYRQRDRKVKQETEKRKKMPIRTACPTGYTRNHRPSSRRTDPMNLFLCAHADCTHSKEDAIWRGFRFKTADDMSRHLLLHKPPQIECPSDKCNKKFRRVDNVMK